MKRPKLEDYKKDLGHVNILNFYINDLNNYINFLESLETGSNKYDDGFVQFFESYHRITGLPKTDKEAAWKHWKKLKLTEKVLAINNIKDYADSINNKLYCKKARTYLADKNFNDEFKKIIINKCGHELESSFD